MKLADLQKIAEHEVDFQRAYRYRINVCCSSGCVPFGALKVLKAFEDAVKELGVEKECKVARTGCIGTCSVGPAVLIEPGDHLYQSVTPEKAREIVRRLYHYFYTHQDELPLEYSVYSDEVARRVVDYIAGMTDQYALRLAEKLLV